MPKISASVGHNGKNQEQDVKVVQRLLNKHPLPNITTIFEDGIVGKQTIKSIRKFQECIVKMRKPDGRVSPGGKTLRYLNRKGKAIVQPGNPNLSGKKWWHANQTKFPNSTRISDLEGGFATKVQKFVDALKKAGATVTITSTRRNKIRAHLMHYSWKLAKGSITASGVPSAKGLNIIWDHGCDSDSKKAAQDMVNLFRMAHIASLRSLHISGKAIDMNISWTGNLVLTLPNGKRKTISSGPKTGNGNRELHRIGRKYFGVKKLLKDPPHWSINGR